METATQRDRCDMVTYLEEQLIFSDSLHRLDQIGRDGVGQSVSLLNFLSTAAKEKLSDATEHTSTI